MLGMTTGATTRPMPQLIAARSTAASSGSTPDPPMTPGGYNQNMQVFQTEDHVVILSEMVHDSRIVPIDGSARTGIGS